MKYHKQIHLYNKEDKYPTGTCYPTVLACLLDLELHEVPNFNQLYFATCEKRSNNLDEYFKMKYLKGQKYEDAEEYQKENRDQAVGLKFNLWTVVVEYYLASLGYIEDWIADVDKFIKENPNVPYMASGTSARGVDHVVIYKNGKPYHDPHPSNTFLIPDKVIHFSGLFPISDYNKHTYYQKIETK